MTANDRGNYLWGWAEAPNVIPSETSMRYNLYDACLEEARGLLEQCSYEIQVARGGKTTLIDIQKMGVLALIGQILFTTEASWEAGETVYDATEICPHFEPRYLVRVAAAGRGLAPRGAAVATHDDELDADDTTDAPEPDAPEIPDIEIDLGLDEDEL
jgi:hypothetical protein